jgi:hypothetical protein
MMAGSRFQSGAVAGRSGFCSLDVHPISVLCLDRPHYNRYVNYTNLIAYVILMRRRLVERSQLAI